jgi:ornithine cyclodeaminase/alanine dehydrogenase-like protein (mu-crystallin family)
MARNTTKIIGSADIARIVQHVGLDALMDDLIDRLIKACETYDPALMPVRERDGFHYTEPEQGLMEWMPAMRIGQHTTLKMVGYHPFNPSKRDLPTILATIGAYDAVTGHMLALTDGTFATALRTGAASGVASRYLAKPDSRVLGIVGCGAQAITQLHAMLRSFEIEQVLFYDIDPAAMASFPERVNGRFGSHLDMRSAAVDLLVQSADIVCTATSLAVGSEPLFHNVTPRPWLHINAVGSDFRGKQELPTGYLKNALVVPDHPEQACLEGECQWLDHSEIGPSLAELVAHPERYAKFREQLTVFDSTGWALEDHVIVEMLLEYADDLGVGTDLPLEHIPADPLDPYDLRVDDDTDEVPQRADL